MALVGTLAHDTPFTAVCTQNMQKYEMRISRHFEVYPQVLAQFLLRRSTLLIQGNITIRASSASAYYENLKTKSGESRLPNSSSGTPYQYPHTDPSPSF